MTDAWAHNNPRTRLYDNLPSYFICDDRYRATYGLPGVGPDDEAPTWVTQAETLPELANQLGIHASGLTAEVDVYNDDARSGKDRRFGRGSSQYELSWGEPDHDLPNPTMGPVEEAPYYGIPLYLAHSGCRGGVVTTPDAEVVRADGGVIQGLYACGNVAANVLLGASYASGSSVGSSIVFGYRAMQHAARV